LIYDFWFEGIEIPGWITVLLSDSVLQIDIMPELADTGCYNVILTAADPLEQMATDTFELCVVKSITGIDGITMDDLDVIIYPNPARGQVTAEFNNTITGEARLRIISLDGRQLFSDKFRGPLKQIIFDMSGRVSGTYLISIQVGDKQMIRKLMVE
jgi:hypothetical protein